MSMKSNSPSVQSIIINRAFNCHFHCVWKKTFSFTCCVIFIYVNKRQVNLSVTLSLSLLSLKANRIQTIRKVCIFSNFISPNFFSLFSWSNFGSKIETRKHKREQIEDRTRIMHVIVWFMVLLFSSFLNLFGLLIVPKFFSLILVVFIRCWILGRTFRRRALTW